MRELDYYLNGFDPEDDMTWERNDDARDARQSQLFRDRIEADPDTTLILASLADPNQLARRALDELRNWREQRAAFDASVPFQDKLPAPPEGFDNSVQEALFRETFKAFQIPPELLDSDDDEQ